MCGIFTSLSVYGCPISVSISHMSGSGEEASINWLYDFYSPNIIGWAFLWIDLWPLQEITWQQYGLMFMGARNKCCPLSEHYIVHTICEVLTRKLNSALDCWTGLMGWEFHMISTQSDVLIWLHELPYVIDSFMLVNVHECTSHMDGCVLWVHGVHMVSSSTLWL